MVGRLAGEGGRRLTFSLRTTKVTRKNRKQHIRHRHREYIKKSKQKQSELLCAKFKQLIEMAIYCELGETVVDEPNRCDIQRQNMVCG